MAAVPRNIEETLALLRQGNYIADRSLATAVFLALKLKRPLFLEGEAGVGKTEIAKVLAATLGRTLVRLQCYEGLDVASAVYEWDYPRQMLEIRLAEAAHIDSKERISADIFSERFLIKRPLLQALESEAKGPKVLLIDELDRTDEPFEAFLLELLSDFQVTIPELGVIKAAEPPIVVITSNRTREIHDALKRRCFYYWVDYPSAERELEILRARLPAASLDLSREVVGFVQKLRGQRPVQAAGRGGDHRLDRCAGAARPGGADAGCDRPFARRPAQIPGRHCAHPRHGSRQAPGRGARGDGRRAALMVAAAPAASRLSENIMQFARALRAAGLPVGPGKAIDAIEAVKAVGIGARDDFYWTFARRLRAAAASSARSSTRPSTSSGATRNSCSA
jgi:MoxR-like ATPase